ncbi:MAG: tungsten ABC transporter substrate-binding protein, partial [Planctomycetes bacterium SM23_65]
MKKIVLAVVVVALVVVGFIFLAPRRVRRLRLATTTSTENSGLLAALVPDFESTNRCKVDVIAVGTGK